MPTGEHDFSELRYDGGTNTRAWGCMSREHPELPCFKDGTPSMVAHSVEGA